MSGADPFAHLVHAPGCICADCEDARPVVNDGSLLFLDACSAPDRSEFVKNLTHASLCELDGYLERTAILSGTPGDIWAFVIHEIRERWIANQGGAR